VVLLGEGVQRVLSLDLMDGVRGSRIRCTAAGTSAFSYPTSSHGGKGFAGGGLRTLRQAQIARTQALASATAGTSLRRVTVEQWLRR
jgi:hypothetical protein